MNRALKTTFLIGVLIICCSLNFLMPLPVTAQPPETIFNITRDDWNYLQYLDYRNTFSYSGVEMRFGEIRVVSSTESKRINIVDWNIPDLTIQDNSGQVEQMDLEPNSRSEDFQLPQDAADIHFYRRTGMWAPSSAFPPDADDPPGGGSGNTPWDVMDKTEWEIQLRDATTHEILQVLNTAGIDAHDDPYSNPFYGDNPRLANHSVAVSQQHAGKTVYIQVVTRRWGSTPYGVTMMKEPGYYFNESAIMDEKGNRRDDAFIAALNNQWFQAVLDYCDEVRSTTGWLPKDTKLWFFTAEQNDIFLARYYEQEVVNGTTVWKAIKYPVSGKPSTGATRDKADIYVPVFSIRSITPNPISPVEPLNISLVGFEEMRLQLAVYTSSGAKAGVVWSGTLAAGKHRLAIDLGAARIAAGAYSLVLEESSGEALSRKALTVIQ